MNQVIKEEMVMGLFQPDTLLPAQYFETFKIESHLKPEKRLMLAVLEDAIVCFQKYLFAKDKRGRQLYEEAEEWIVNWQNYEGTFSFQSICEVLNFDPDYICKGLLAWEKERLRVPQRRLG